MYIVNNIFKYIHGIVCAIDIINITTRGLTLLLILEKLFPRAHLKILRLLGHQVVTRLTSPITLVLVQVDKVLFVQHLVEFLIVEQQNPIDKYKLVLGHFDDARQFFVKLFQVDGRYYVEIVRVHLGQEVVVKLVALVIEVVLWQVVRVGKFGQKFFGERGLAAIRAARNADELAFDNATHLYCRGLDSRIKRKINAIFL